MDTDDAKNKRALVSVNSEDAVGPSEVGEVYRREWDGLVARARFFVDDPDEAQDLVQRAVLVLLERISERENELPADPRSFLTGCLPNLARNDRERRRRRTQLLAASDPPRVAPDHARSVEARCVCERILDELSPSDAWLLRVRYLDNLAPSAIAERLGTTSGAVRDRLYRARRRARKAVARVEDQGPADDRGNPRSDGTGGS